MSAQADASNCVANSANLPNQPVTAVAPCPGTTPTTWVELYVVDDRVVGDGASTANPVPIADERCFLFSEGVPTFSKEGRTDARGFVRFDKLTPTTPGQKDRYYVQFPDILEEWKDRETATSKKKNKKFTYHGKHYDQKLADGVIHPVQQEQKEQYVPVNQLTEEEKFQHFRDAYVENKAIYVASSPRRFDTGTHRWSWGKGSVCNQHVNFFLGYWFNYNAKFTTKASQGAMLDLVLNSSHDDQAVDRVGKKVKKQFLGYREFVEPVAGSPTFAGKRFSARRDPGYNDNTNYLRISHYFDFDTGNPNDDGRQLIDSLADYNVYSVGDNTWGGETKAKHTAAEKDIKKWLKGLDGDDLRRGGKSDEQIDKLSEDDTWKMVWDLDEADPDEARLLKAFYNSYVDRDHHAGLLLRRAPGNRPPADLQPGEDYELWTFSADGSKTWTPPIIMREFAGEVTKRRKGFFHLAIWRIKSLRSGGYATKDDDTYDMSLESTAVDKKAERIKPFKCANDLDDPSRLIDWT
jgi:hypothetical protein